MRALTYLFRDPPAFSFFRPGDLPAPYANTHYDMAADDADGAGFAIPCLIPGICDPPRVDAVLKTGSGITNPRQLHTGLQIRRDQGLLYETSSVPAITTFIEYIPHERLSTKPITHIVCCLDNSLAQCLSWIQAAY